MNNGVYTNPIIDSQVAPVEYSKKVRNGADFIGTLSKSESYSTSTSKEFKTNFDDKNIDVKDEFNKASLKTKNKVDLKEQDTDLDDNSTKIIEDITDILVKKFADELNVSEEEIRKALENLSLIPVDLLNHDYLCDIIMEVNGMSDSMDLITNSDLSGLVRNLEEITKSDLDLLCGELGITVDELKDSINLIKNNSYELNAVFDEITEFDENIGFEIPDVRHSDSDDKADSDFNETANNSNANGYVSSEGYNPSVNDTLYDNQTGISDYGVDVQEIYNRIGDYIRTSSSEELKEVELQLQPESLGTVQIRVMQREGSVSAEMIAQNDNVKAILESQLIQLKDDFDKAGITVNEIEVKVSTNSYNESSESDSRDDANDEAFTNRPARRINLSDFAEIEDIDELEEDEKIAAEMMTANGNTMDYLI